GKKRAGEVRGVPFGQNPANTKTPDTSYQKVWRMAIKAHPQSRGKKTTRAVIEAYQKLGALEFFLGDIQKAQDNYQQSLPLAQDFWRRRPEDPTRGRLLAMNYARLGDLQLDNLETDKALNTFLSPFPIFCSD